MTRNIFTILGTILLSATVLPDCGTTSDESGIVPAEAPNAITKDDGASDQADSSCFVVLRSIGRLSNNQGGYQTTCDVPGNTSSDCLYIWEGHVDVDKSRLSQVKSVKVLFKTSLSLGKWYSATAKTESGDDNGFAHYVFQINKYTPFSSMSFTSLNETVIDFIPFVNTAQGRIFDHNRVSDPLDSYHLTKDNGWTLGPAPVCQPPATNIPEYVLSYPDFQETLNNGPVVPVGKLKVIYDGRRLRDTQPCMGGEGPVSATNLSMSWMINGDFNNIQSVQVEHYVESYGTACQGQTPPCITDQDTDPVIDVPANAQNIALWFTCVAFGHGDPSGYDSNDGQNYIIQVQNSTPPAAPVQWAGNWHGCATPWGTNGDACVVQGVGLTEPVMFQRNAANWMCAYVSAQVYVPGLTDNSSYQPTAIQGFADWTMDGGAQSSTPLTYLGVDGHNYVYAWNLQAGELARMSWQTIRYSFRFSTDGTTWYRIAKGDGPDGGDLRTIVHADAPGWVGNWLAKLSRDDTDACAGGSDLGGGFNYDTWARERATVTNVCFEVWKQGVTDFDNPNLWQQLDVQVFYRFGDGQFSSEYVDNVGRPGNNARYAIDLRGLDPFRPYNCPTDIPITTVDQGGQQYLQARMQFFITVNGIEIRPGDAGSLFTGTFTDYPSNPWRQANCPQ